MYATENESLKSILSLKNILVSQIYFLSKILFHNNMDLRIFFIFM